MTVEYCLVVRLHARVPQAVLEADGGAELSGDLEERALGHRVQPAARAPHLLAKNGSEREPVEHGDQVGKPFVQRVGVRIVDFRLKARAQAIDQRVGEPRGPPRRATGTRRRARPGILAPASSLVARKYPKRSAPIWGS